jgi:hypothetical protein
VLRSSCPSAFLTTRWVMGVLVLQLDATAADTYRYLNFDQLPEYTEKSDKVEIENWPTLMAELRAAKTTKASA